MTDNLRSFPPRDDPDGHTPPNDVMAERAVIGDVMRSPAVIHDIHLVGRDFYQPAHETIWDTITSLHRAGQPFDPVAVAAALSDAKLLSRVGGAPYLHTLFEAALGSPGYHAERITEMSRRRQLVTAGQRITQAALTGQSSDEILDEAVTGLHGIRAFTDDVETLMTFDEFVDQPLPAEEWVIPNLLARGDRLVLTGSEGLGKSTVCRQFAVCAAAGIDPFTHDPIRPQTVLVVDAENPKRIMVNRFADLRSAARRRGITIAPNRLWIDRRPDGMDLSSAKDRRWLSRRVEMVQPDLLVLGPAYKLFFTTGQSRDEELARQVTSALDQIREQASCALILEHHSGHQQASQRVRDVRPIGSSLWLRWPEFGMGIRTVPVDEDETAEYRRLVDLVPWRGPRDERPWPKQLEAGHDGWPWIAARHD